MCKSQSKERVELFLTNVQNGKPAISFSKRYRGFHLAATEVKRTDLSGKVVTETIYSKEKVRGAETRPNVTATMNKGIIIPLAYLDEREKAYVEERSEDPEMVEKTKASKKDLYRRCNDRRRTPSNNPPPDDWIPTEVYKSLGGDKLTKNVAKRLLAVMSIVDVATVENVPGLKVSDTEPVKMLRIVNNSVELLDSLCPNLTPIF